MLARTLEAVVHLQMTMSGRDEPTMENKSLLRHKTMATTTTSASPLQRRHRVASSSSSSQSARLASAYLRRFALCSLLSLSLSFCISLSPLSLLSLPSLSRLLCACSFELLMKIVQNPKRKHCPPPSSAAHKANQPHRLILIKPHSVHSSTDPIRNPFFVFYS